MKSTQIASSAPAGSQSFVAVIQHIARTSFTGFIGGRTVLGNATYPTKEAAEQAAQRQIDRG